jgi:hypothetical protein
MSEGRRTPCSCVCRGGAVVLANGFLEVEIPERTAVIAAVTNLAAGRRFVMAGDAAEVEVRADGGAKRRWIASADAEQDFSVTLEDGPDCARAVFRRATGAGTVSLEYELKRSRFWIERALVLQDAPRGATLDRVVYGRLTVEGAGRRVLDLGRFDRPVIVSSADGRAGLFGGVAWWFCSMSDEGVYENRDADFPVSGELRFEPFYVGVTLCEAEEPYPGWLWYKAFLEDRKHERDRQDAWCHWNAGWGMAETEVDSPQALRCLEFADRIGLPHVVFGHGGHGYELPGYVHLARTDTVTRENLAAAAARGIVVGALDFCANGDDWADEEAMRRRFKTLDEYAAAGFGAAHFDYFRTPDTFRAHRSVTEYFRAARAKLQYTECHLGMATYGPQFQAEVLINHPTDVGRFSLTPFSSDWCTFLSFRASRREWQRQRDYLMPEYGLYYFATHYRNPCGMHRAYTDPEPQQFLTTIPAYTGISFNFNDVFGLRRSLIAAAAFSPFVVLGYLELTMPEEDVRFVRQALQWARDNADALRPARVCYEDEDACVVSKIVDDAGALALINYSPGARTMRLRLDTGIAGRIRVRKVFPAAEEPVELRDGDAFTASVPGESVAVFDVNGGLRTLPPEDRPPGEIEVAGWTRSGRRWNASFEMPDLRQALAAGADPSLPRELESLDQAGQAAFPITADGRLPAQFTAAYGFRQDRFVGTWEFAPWAYRDRVWLVWCPQEAPRLAKPGPAVTLDGTPLTLRPRVDTRPGKDPGQWPCPLLFADVTALCAAGGRHRLEVSDLAADSPGLWRLVWAA